MGDQYKKMAETEVLTRKEQQMIAKFKKKYCDTDKSPIQKSGLFSKAFFMWIGPLFKVRKNFKIPQKTSFFQNNKEGKGVLNFYVRCILIFTSFSLVYRCLTF